MSFPHDGPPEVVLDFREALEDLQRNDQYQIENLTMIAKEATEFAQAISQEVESHIRKTRPEYKLPALYLLDSLVKHIGTPYTVYLSRNLYRTFFDSYTVVDNNTRRAMDELFRSWMQPVPESRDPRPVFPVDVTAPIDAALSKMRGVDQKSKEAAEASRIQKMHALPARVGQIHQPGRTPTPNGQYAYQPPPPHVQTPPQKFSAFQNMPYPAQPPTHHLPPAIRSPAPDLPSPIRQGIMSVNQPYPQPPQQAGTPVQYVYSGPPPSTMSHQSRLDKLRMDVQGLTELAKTHLARYPYDVEKQKLLPNLESLKRLLDTGTLSLTHIQSTEVVIANIARDFAKPPPTPPPSQGPPPPVQSALPFDPSKIAAILAKSTPQPTPPQIPVLPYAPAPPVVSTPQFSQAFPATAAPVAPPSGIPPASMAQIMSLLNPSSRPSSVGHTPVPAAAPAASSIMDQLRLSGLLGGPPIQTTPMQTQTPGAASILSQLMQPAPGAQAMNDVKLEAASLKIKRPYLIRQLYQDKPDQCRQCGMRFPPNEQGKAAKGVHLDWHFKVNTRVQDSMKNAINRSWYIDERDWIAYREELDGYSGVVTAGGSGKANGTKQKRQQQFVFVPTDARLVNLPCSICQEKFEQGWDEETQQPIWKDAVKVGNKYYHATCWAEVSKGQAAATSAMDGLQMASARSTPDAVLGKRKLDDYKHDATS